MGQWDLLNQLFTVVVEFDATGEVTRASPLVRERFQLADNEAFDFFGSFEFKRPARFSGGLHEALASPGRLFLGHCEAAKFAIRGQIITAEDDSGSAWFAGVPWLAWMRDHYGAELLHFNDFPPHDSQMDQLLLLSSQQRMLEDLQEVNGDLQEAKVALEGQAGIRQNFFNRVSHEVRTPLTGISSALALLRDGLSDPKSRALITMADASVDRAIEVVNFALGDASGDMKDQDALAVAVDLRHLVAKVAKLFEAGALEKGLTLETQVDDALSASYWCPDLIVREALINLVSNAVKFTETGWVSLSVKLENPSVETGGHQIIFTVADSGPGIPANLRKTAFAPFETGITQETRHGGGTGLGLSSTAAALKRIGGSISLGDSHTGGAMFSIDLTLQICADSPQIETDEVAEQVYVFDHSLLLLDDSPTNLSLNGQLLESIGFSVTRAASGSEALAIAESSVEPFDVALLDINLPDMTGYEVAEKLTTLPACKHTVLVALSAYSEAKEKQEAADAGMVAFVTKPFKRDAIAALLASMLTMTEFERSGSSSSEQQADAAFEPMDLAEMIELMGGEAVVTLANTLEVEGLENLQGLRSALVAMEYHTAEREAHTLASSCLALGLVSVGRQLRQVESDMRDGNRPDASVVPGLELMFTEGLANLRDHLNGLQSR